MLYTKKFVFTVSLCAMLAVNPVLAVTDPVSAVAGAKSGTPGVVSTVYSDWAGRANSGIAGVTYVNSAVDAAGNAAQWAENHAAAAAQSAKSAADSAAQAASKVSIDQGADNKNKAMVTDDAGSVYAGYVAPGMIVGGSKIDDIVTSPYSGFVLWSDHDGNVSWKTVDSEVLADGGVKADDIASAAVTADKIANGAVTTNKIRGANSYTGFLASRGLETSWRLVGADDIADGAVTSGKIADGAVTSGTIADGAVTSGTIVNGAVMTDKIADGAVTADKIAVGAVTSGVIAYHAVTTDKIADKSVGLGKLSYYNAYASGSISDGIPLTTIDGTGLALSQISSVGIADGAVTAEKIASPSDQSGVLFSDGSVPRWRMIGSDMLMFGAVIEGNIAAGAVTKGKIANGAVTIDKTAGVVGMVPVGSADATTYGQFWIE